MDMKKTKNKKLASLALTTILIITAFLPLLLFVGKNNSSSDQIQKNSNANVINLTGEIIASRRQAHYTFEILSSYAPANPAIGYQVMFKFDKNASDTDPLNWIVFKPDTGVIEVGQTYDVYIDITQQNPGTYVSQMLLDPIAGQPISSQAFDIPTVLEISTPSYSIVDIIPGSTSARVDINVTGVDWAYPNYYLIYRLLDSTNAEVVLGEVTTFQKQNGTFSFVLNGLLQGSYTFVLTSNLENFVTSVSRQFTTSVTPIEPSLTNLVVIPSFDSAIAQFLFIPFDSSQSWIFYRLYKVGTTPPSYIQWDEFLRIDGRISLLPLENLDLQSTYTIDIALTSDPNSYLHSATFATLPELTFDLLGVPTTNSITIEFQINPGYVISQGVKVYLWIKNTSAVWETVGQEYLANAGPGTNNQYTFTNVQTGASLQPGTIYDIAISYFPTQIPGQFYTSQIQTAKTNSVIFNYDPSQLTQYQVRLRVFLEPIVGIDWTSVAQTQVLKLFVRVTNSQNPIAPFLPAFFKRTDPIINGQYPPVVIGGMVQYEFILSGLFNGTNGQGASNTVTLSREYDGSIEPGRDRTINFTTPSNFTFDSNSNTISANSATIRFKVNNNINTGGRNNDIYFYRHWKNGELPPSTWQMARLQNFDGRIENEILLNGLDSNTDYNLQVSYTQNAAASFQTSFTTTSSNRILNAGYFFENNPLAGPVGLTVVFRLDVPVTSSTWVVLEIPHLNFSTVLTSVNVGLNVVAISTISDWGLELRPVWLTLSNTGQRELVLPL